MPYSATVVNVMVATPADVQAERQIVRDVLQEWNALNAASSQVVLLPVGWDSHSFPAMGDRPQALINKQVLAGADILVAIFWTRLGSPTGTAPSGTAEEIREHIHAGKPAMVYFCEEPVRLDSVDEEQYRSLRAFRGECEQQGLVQPYETRSAFKDVFRRQISQAVKALHLSEAGASATKTPEVHIGFLEVSSSTPARLPQLSDSAKRLLVEAACDSDGVILRLRTLGGFSIQTNGKNLVEDRTPRTAAQWEGAIRELVDAELITDVGHKGEVFQVTQAGYAVADQLRVEM